MPDWGNSWQNQHLLGLKRRLCDSKWTKWKLRLIEFVICTDIEQRNNTRPISCSGKSFLKISSAIWEDILTSSLVIYSIERCAVNDARALIWRQFTRFIQMIKQSQLQKLSSMSQSQLQNKSNVKLMKPARKVYHRMNLYPMKVSTNVYKFTNFRNTIFDWNSLSSSFIDSNTKV